MGDLEEALRNIDAYCRVLVKKTIGAESREYADGLVEPIENLLRRKSQSAEEETSYTKTSFIPLPQLENPLVDVFEDEDKYKILVQCHCRDQTVTVHTDVSSIEICTKECYPDAERGQACKENCQRFDVPVEEMQIEKMNSKCINNEVLEIEIPKRNRV
jgi:hypothetical protein